MEQNAIRVRPLAIPLIILTVPLFLLFFPRSKSSSKAVNGHSTPNIRVSKILVHPIKSCKGTAVSSSRYTASGLENDRKWAIVDAESKVVITARDYSRLVLVVPTIIDHPSAPHEGVLQISFPEDSGCESFAVPLNPTPNYLSTCERLDNLEMWGRPIDGYVCNRILTPTTQTHHHRSPSEILSSFLDVSVLLVVKGPRPRNCNPTPAFPSLEATQVFQDGYPLLFMSQESVDAVEAEVRKYVGVSGIQEKWKDEKLVIERFRPNIVLQGGDAFCEDKWEEITLMSPNTSTDGDNEGRSTPHRFRLVSKCTRCLLPNVDPATGISDQAVPFKALTKFRLGVDKNFKSRPCLGVNACPLEDGGIIQVGDIVQIDRLNPSSS